MQALQESTPSVSAVESAEVESEWHDSEGTPPASGISVAADVPAASSQAEVPSLWDENLEQQCGAHVCPAP